MTWSTRRGCLRRGRAAGAAARPESALPWRGERRPLRECRGAVSIIAAVSMFFVMAATALSVDVGHVVYRDRRLESTVDLAAIDASRAIGDRRDPARNALEVAEEFARESATRNDFDYDDAGAGNSLTVEI